ncbi:hypothetical protein PV326_004438 [Microctonus aethiopoides]|nr:hypothetical protein PV326_004438 [Microctonus aethiopoides]
MKYHLNDNIKFEAVKVASSLGLQGPSAPIGGAQLLVSGSSEDAPTTTVYHANLVTGSNNSLQQSSIITSLNSAAVFASMQASAEANSLDLQAMQSMDWLFKKERIYLLAQFWQQPTGWHDGVIEVLNEREVSSYRDTILYNI